MRQPLGQHFLNDPNVIEAILTAAELVPSDHALEIGPGKGVLTRPLAARVNRLVVVELDRKLASELLKRVSAKRPPLVVHGDILKTDLDPLFSLDERPVKVLGNLPYSITAPIFEKLLVWPAWDIGVFLIQKEVAERIRAESGSKAYGILSLAVQLYATAEEILTVGPEAFTPPPEVYSSVIRLRRRAVPLLPPTEAASFFDLVRASFAHRRKTILNSLVLHTGIDKNKLAKWLQAQSIEIEARAEVISLETYVHTTKK